MPRIRHGGAAQHVRREAHQVVSAAEPAQKKRRLMQLGSSPPPFTTAAQHLATRPRRSRHEEPEPPHAASTSPRIVLVRRNKPLDLRCSSLPSPSRDPQVTSGIAAPAPTEPHPDPTCNADSVSRRSRRDLLQQKPQLDCSVASSPIGTFGGPLRSSRSLGSSHIGSSEQSSKTRSARTVGLPPLNRDSHLRVEHRTIQRSRTVSEATAAQKENEAHPNGNSSKRTADDPPVKSRRRRTKIQRVQLGGGLPSSSAEQPLSDADHQLNSQADAADGGADESEISYFATLRPTSHAQTDSDDSQHDASEAVHPILRTGPTISITHESRSEALDAQDVTVGRAEEKRMEEGDSSAGLLEVLSQSAIRKLDEGRVAQHSDRRSADYVEAQHQVQVDFHPAHFSETQAQRLAVSLVSSKEGSKWWTSVHPDVTSERERLSTTRLHGSRRSLQAACKPPSPGAICRDLGLSPSQMMKRPLGDVPDFDHHGSALDQTGLLCDDLVSLESFEHGLRFAGYREASKDHPRALCDPTELLPLQPFNEPAFQQRRQKRCKEVVKVIVPFSEPSLSMHATRARFVAPIPPSHSLQSRPPLHAHDDSVTLIWMQSTAHSFFKALETMLQAGSVRSAQSCSSSHRLDTTDSDLYPCPILHYAAHAETGQPADQATAPSHVALYVHVDRLEEARRKLAELELGSGTSYRPFSDPAVRLLVTSLAGEALCLI